MIFGKEKYFATITSTKVFQNCFEFLYFGNKRGIWSKIKKIENGQKLMKNTENR